MRAEDEWWEPTPQPTVGYASASSEVPESSADFAGRLLLPDPEARRGWREFYVKRPPKPSGRRIGFRR